MYINMLGIKTVTVLTIIILILNGVETKPEVSMEKAKIFQNVVKGTNFFTPIIDSYHTVGNHIIELSCSEKDNQHGLYNREVDGITFKGKYGVTVITNEGDGWKRSTELDKLCDSRDEAIKYIKSLDNA